MRKEGRLYLWVLGGIAVGGLIGAVSPATGIALKPLGDGFIALIKMLIAPVIFCSVTLGIAGMEDLKKLGRVGFRSLLYFEIVSTVALGLGLLVGNVLKPGSGFHASVQSLDAATVGAYITRARELSPVDYLLHIIPASFGDIFTGNGDLLQVLLVSILFGISLAHLGVIARPAIEIISSISKVLFGMVGIVMFAAPFGAGGAMAFTIGKYGIKALGPLAYLMGCFYVTCALFIFIVLGGIAHWTGFSIFRFLRYIRQEILTVLGTSSSETALAPLMEKLERLGCSRSVVGLVVPAGYSFNLDGTNIYMTLATLFIAQALGVELTVTQQLTITGVAMLTSKGASGVTGSGFVTLAATLAVVPALPVAGMALILGIDRFMSEARAITNHIGNGVACLAVAKWDRDLDMETLRRELSA